MAPTLPRFVMFEGDNGHNLCLYPSEGHPYLCFNTTNRDLWGTHEVIPVPNEEGVVMIKCLYNQRWWRRGTNWIWADRSETPDSSVPDCLFKVVQLSPKKVALQCLANQRYVKRLSTEGKTNALNASAPEHSNDTCAQMKVTEALSTKRIYDVKYLLDQMETTDTKPLVLGSATAKNKTSSKTDLAVTVTYEVSESSTWSDSSTFTTGLSVTVTAGVPDVASASGTRSTEFSSTTEMGKENGKKTTMSSTYTVKDVAPGDEVTVKVSGTQATAKVPYTYKSQATRVDGLTMPVETGVDGIFKGVQVVDIQWEATDKHGAPKALLAK